MDNENNINEYVEKMKHTQQILLDFFEKETNQDTDFQQLITYLNEQKIQENANELKMFLHLIAKISNNYHRSPFFFTKIEQIIKNFENEIKNFYSNYEIFNIFKGNKRTLLFLFEEKFIIPNQFISDIITNNKYKQNYYPHYFYPEFKNFYDEKLKEEINSMISNYKGELFDKYRKAGENDFVICQLIRNDSIDEFVATIQKANISMATVIKPSIFETNTFLLNKSPTLIEYAAFYGSVDIIKHLYVNKIKLTPSLWLYAMHNQKTEMILFLEQNHLKPYDESYKECLIESIKCHHTEFSNYIRYNLRKTQSKNDVTIDSQCFRYYNFICFPENLNNESNFYDFCLYDYPILVKFLITDQKLNVNYKKVTKI